MDMESQSSGTLGAICSYFLVSYLLWLSFIIFLASIGKSFGVRSTFIKVMIFLFEWGKQRIALYEKGKEENGGPENGTSDAEDTDSGRVIERQEKQLLLQRSIEDMKHEFQLEDPLFFCKQGIEAIIEDEVTNRFQAEELTSWNLLTRTNNNHVFISFRLTILYYAGWVLRYIILFPFRLSLAIVAIGVMIMGTAVIGTLIPPGRLRRFAYYRLSVTCYRIMARSFSALVTFHNKENRAKGGGICVANHTSPIDIIILGCDNTYAMVGQQQGGFFGVMQKAFSRGESHVWFNRAEAKDRAAVAKRLQDHISDKNKLPILIFPEGTCINNTSIMMFKKGSFETGGVIYPAAIKYDSRFADAFWNSSKYNLITHLLMIMTSWSLVCDVWYLPPEHQRDGETAVQFANRVKSEIARQGGMVDLEWDGGLKRSQPKPQMMQKKQAEYSKHLKEN